MFFIRESKQVQIMIVFRIIYCIISRAFHLGIGAKKRCFLADMTHSAKVVHGTSFSDVTLRGRPTLGPYKSFQDVFLRPGVRRT